MEPIFHSIIELHELVGNPCTDCCTGGYNSYHRPLCSASDFKPTRRKAVLKHLTRSHWKTRVESSEGRLVRHYKVPDLTSAWLWTFNLTENSLPSVISKTLEIIFIDFC